MVSALKKMDCKAANVAKYGRKGCQQKMDFHLGRSSKYMSILS